MPKYKIEAIIEVPVNSVKFISEKIAKTLNEEVSKSIDNPIGSDAGLISYKMEYYIDEKKNNQL